MKISSYMHYQSKNYGKNALLIEFGKYKFYFSYKTCIAFHIDGQLWITKNYWGSTTGKHLNAINPDKSIRLDDTAFTAALNQVQDKLDEIQIEV